MIAAALAMSVDVVQTGYGVKGDEATYVAAALSAAYDGDLSFERRDLERFWGLYRTGPEGIFLKRGKTLELRRSRTFPYVLRKRPDPRSDRLYFGKALVYPLVAAPFVRVFGLNGMLLLHVMLLAVVGLCGYLFLVARSSAVAAAVFTTSFLGASALPVYAVFLTPEIFNFALVFVAYFLWLYKEVAPARTSGAGVSDLVAALLLGVATYSKPSNGILIAPLVLLAARRRRWLHGAAVAAVFVTTTAVLFGFNAAVSGEFNYQGGDRKTFYARFPFESPDATWERRGSIVGTSGSAQQEVLGSRELPGRFIDNVEYFLIGRHFGLVPYMFPGAVSLALWLLSRARRDTWRILTFLAFVTTAVVLLVVLPYTWSGGGGPSGNRYLLSVYPTLFFLVPPLGSPRAGVVAWLGGALFTAKMLMNPFVAAKYPYLMTERGLARRLPVELTMINDLPINLDASRAHIPYRNDPVMLLYFLDQNAFSPEPPGMWVSGSGRSDIVVRTVDPLDHLAMTAASPIHTILTVSIGGGPRVRVELAPGQVATFDVAARGVRYVQSYAYLMSIRSSEGFTPHLQDSSSLDFRNLGALVQFRAVVKTRVS